MWRRSDSGRVATAVAQRHGGASRCDAATDLICPLPFDHPAVACGRGFPSLSKEGSLVPGFATETSLDQIVAGRPINLV